MIKLSERPDLKKYEDYRGFLRDYAVLRREKNPRWSYSLWARRLGFRSKSPLLMVVNGHRKASDELVDKLVGYFRFSKTEESFFRILVKNSNPAKPVHVHELLNKTQNLGNVAEVQNPLLTTWLACVVKEAASLLGNETQETLSSQVLEKHSSETITEVLSALVSTGLLLPHPTDPTKLRLTAQAPSLKWTPEAVKKLHFDCLDASRTAFEKLSPEERSFRVSFLKIKKDRLPEASMLLKRFQRDFTDHFEDVSGDEVFQLNLQLFPVTRGLGN